MFFSSLKDSLTVLGASKKDDLQIDYNTVYIITDGDFANAEKHKVSRLQAGQNEEVIYNTRTRYFGNEYYDWENYEDVREINKNARVATDIETSNSLMTNLHNDKPIKAIIDYNGKVYSKSLRYWENGSLINGIYVYIKNYGFKFAGIDTVTTNAFIKNIKGLTFNCETGIFNYNILNKDGFIPFKKDVDNIQLHYFVNGVLLKTFEDYNRAVILQKQLKIPAKYIDHQILSYISKHPIIDMDPTKTMSIAMFDGKPFTGNITELGFEKIYYFMNGVLTKWVKREDLVNKVETPVIILPAVTDINKNPFDKNYLIILLKLLKILKKILQ